MYIIHTHTYINTYISKYICLFYLYISIYTHIIYMCNYYTHTEIYKFAIHKIPKNSNSFSANAWTFIELFSDLGSFL